MTVGLQINALRRQRGLTLEELSALCGVHRDDLGLYERGAMTPRPETVARIAQALDVPIAAIQAGMGWTAPRPTEDWPEGTACSGTAFWRPPGRRGTSPWRNMRCWPCWSR